MAPSVPPLSLTLTLGCKNEKQPSGPIELVLEAGILFNTGKFRFSKKQLTHKQTTYGVTSVSSTTIGDFYPGE